MADLDAVTAAVQSLGGSIRALTREVARLRDAVVAGWAAASVERQEVAKVAAEQRDAFRALLNRKPEDDRVGDAVDDVKVKAIGKIGGALDIPIRLWGAWMWIFESKQNTATALAMAVTAVTALRILAGIIPGAEPIAMVLDATMNEISPLPSGTSTP